MSHATQWQEGQTDSMGSCHKITLPISLESNDLKFLLLSPGLLHFLSANQLSLPLLDKKYPTRSSQVHTEKQWSKLTSLSISQL